MSGFHGPVTTLYGSVDTPVHRVGAPVKVVCLFTFLFAVVVTPEQAIPAFALYALMVVVAARLARIPLSVMARRLLIEIPFVVFAVALPFIGLPPHRYVVGIAVSVPGLWAAWSILVKATLGTAATVLFAWSTPVVDILGALERLRVPRVLTAIAGFMIRYLEIVTAELRQLQIARVSRGDNPRWLWQVRAVATTIGALFVRSFERGERVHNSMVARGFTGTFPSNATASVRLQWFPALIWPVTAWLVAGVAILR